MFVLISFLLLSLVNASSLEIHYFEVGQGDSQLIIFPSGYSILIDAGETSSSSKNCKLIAERIKALTGGHVDVAVLTHLHTDHYGFTFSNGFWYLLESSGITFGKFIDRSHGTIKSGITDCQNVDTSSVNWKNAGTTSKVGAQWICYSQSGATTTQIHDILETAQHCSTSQIKPSDDGAEVEIVVVDAPGIKDTDGTSLQGDRTGKDVPPSENDYSVCLRIKYGDFVYATCGDLDGELADSYGYRYHNVESAYKDVMGSVDLFKANHHGSSHSNNAEWMNTLAPTVSVITCGAGNSYGHPRVEAVANMDAVSERVYVMEDCNPSVTNNYASTYIAYDEVVVKYTKGSSTFTVTSVGGGFTHTYNIKTNKPSRKACGVYSN